MSEFLTPTDRDDPHGYMDPGLRLFTGFTGCAAFMSLWNHVNPVARLLRAKLSCPEAPEGDYRVTFERLQPLDIPLKRSNTWWSGLETKEGVYTHPAWTLVLRDAFGRVVGMACYRWCTDAGMLPSSPAYRIEAIVRVQGRRVHWRAEETMCRLEFRGRGNDTSVCRCESDCEACG